MKATELFPHRISIVTGHYGTGKTEFAVNLALAFAREGEKTAIADLDIVNPYFRSRERQGIMENEGIRVICSSQEHAFADMPTIPPELITLFEDRSYKAVLDIGGDPVGARVLARFLPYLEKEDYQLIYVSNAYRPEVRTFETAERYLRSIEAVTGLTCSAIINNTHLCGETSAEDVLAGEALALELSEGTGIKAVCSTAVSRIWPQLSESRLPLFPVEILMKKPWEAK